MLEWTEEMATGLPKVDAQHKELLKKLSEFSDIFSKDSLNGKKIAEAENILDFVQFYAVWHFSKEEEYFEQYQCPGAEANKKAHMQFRKMFGEFYEQWQSDGMEIALAEKTFDALTDWFTNHILKIDTQLHKYVEEQTG